MTLAEIPRWQPDELLVPAILARQTTVMDDLSIADQAWVCLTLKDAGYTAEFTAERLGCSVRAVRSRIADDIGQVMRRYMDTAETNDRERTMAASEVARLAAALGEAERDRDRYLAERNRLIDRLMGDDWSGPRFRCGCPMSKYNTYVAPKTGKRGCRHHRTLAQARYRQRRVATPIAG
ncbi:DNA binding protein [Mycobacterium phage Funsized]|nr:DNA binding protein [Mycobacterium phage Funsized]